MQSWQLFQKPTLCLMGVHHFQVQCLLHSEHLLSVPFAFLSSSTFSPGSQA